MLRKGLINEVEADPRKCEPLWREGGDGHGPTFIATEAVAGKRQERHLPITWFAVAQDQQAVGRHPPRQYFVAQNRSWEWVSRRA